MKYLVTLLISLIASTSAAENVVEEIIKYKDWEAVIVNDHPVRGKQACVAQVYSKDKKARLEVYSEFNAGENFVEPVIQVVSSDQPTALGGMIVASPGRTKLPVSVSLPEASEEPSRQVFIGKYSMKSQFIKLLKRKNRIDLSYYSPEGQTGKTRFSLRGSSRVISKAIERCQLKALHFN